MPDPNKVPKEKGRSLYAELASLRHKLAKFQRETAKIKNDRRQYDKFSVAAKSRLDIRAAEQWMHLSRRCSEKLEKIAEETQELNQRLIRTEWLGPWNGFDLTEPSFVLVNISDKQRELAAKSASIKKSLENEVRKLKALELKARLSQEPSSNVTTLLENQKQHVVSLEVALSEAQDKVKTNYLLEKLEGTKAAAAKMRESAHRNLIINDIAALFGLRRKQPDVKTFGNLNPQKVAFIKLASRFPHRVRRSISELWMADCLYHTEKVKESLDLLLARKNEFVGLVFHLEASSLRDPTKYADQVRKLMETACTYLTEESISIESLLKNYFAAISHEESRLSIERTNSTIDRANSVLGKTKLSVNKGLTLVDRIEAKILERERRAALSFMSAPSKELDLSKFGKLLKLASKDLQHLQRATNKLIDRREGSLVSAKEFDSFVHSIALITSTQEHFRETLQRIRRMCIDSLAHAELDQIEVVSDSMLLQAMRAFHALISVTNDQQCTIVEKLKSIDDLASAEYSAIQKLAERHMVHILTLLDSILAHRVWLLEDICLWRQIESYSNELKNDDNLIIAKAKPRIAFITETISTIDKDCSIYRGYQDQLKKSMTFAGFHESFDDKVVRIKSEWIISQDEKTKSVDISKFLSTIEAPLERITALLERFENVAFAHQNLPDVKLTQQSPAPKFLQRQECRKILTELITAETQVRGLTRTILCNEIEKLNLWQRRVLVAQKIGDDYLAVRARKRQEIHERVVSCLEPQEFTLPAALPPFFGVTRTVVERIEQKCGLVPNTILRENSLVFALSLFDRVYFLLENLEYMLDSSGSDSDSASEVQ